MRILLLGRSSNAGGGPAWAANLIRGLSERGHSCRIIFTRIGTRSNFMHKRLANAGFVVEPLCYRYPQQDYPGDLATFIQSWRPDRLLIDNRERMAEVFPFCECLRTRDTKVVFINHCQGTPVSLLQELSPYLWKIICVSERSARPLAQFNPVVIRNAVYPPPGRGEDVRAKFGIPQEVFLVGYLGRFDSNKAGRNGQDPRHILFDALQGNEHWLLLAGKGAPSPPPELEASAKDRIRVWGAEVEFIADWYRVLDVYMLPSKDEGFPLAPLEALLCGCRVAMTRTSDFEDLFGESAIAFFDHGDLAGMREAILRAPDPSLGQKVIAEQLSVERMLDQYEEALA